MKPCQWCHQKDVAYTLIVVDEATHKIESLACCKECIKNVILMPFDAKVIYQNKLLQRA